MDTHAYILPIDILFCKLLYHVAIHLLSLPTAHPLAHCTHSASQCKVKHHLSPIHHLVNFAGLDPKDIETISLVRRSPGYNPVFKSVMPPLKEVALPFAILTNETSPVHVYSNSSRFEGGIGASALLYVNNPLARSLQFFLGTAQEHTIYEAEGVGLILSLHLLHGLMWQLTHTTVLCMDSQAVIKVLNNQHSHSGHYLLDAIHLAAERLHTKQDGIINHNEHIQTIGAGDQWKGDSMGVIDLQIHWVPGHCDFVPNERADEEAKLAIQGSSSDAIFLPPLLHKKLPLSISTLHQENSVKLKKRWSRC